MTLARKPPRALSPPKRWHDAPLSATPSGGWEGVGHISGRLQSCHPFGIDVNNGLPGMRSNLTTLDSFSEIYLHKAAGSGLSKAYLLVRRRRTRLRTLCKYISEKLENGFQMHGKLNPISNIT